MTAPLRQLADDASIRIGTCVNRRAFETDDAYRDVLAREFNVVTPENWLKPGLIHPEADRYDFDAGDALVVFAEEQRMEVHGHTLVWHNQNPAWLQEGTWSRGDLLRIMQEHIETVVGRYSGRIAMWDVVNEGIESEGGVLRPTFWHKIVGPDYFDYAFRWAHEADPSARLFYNDFGADDMNEKSDAMYKLVSGMLDRGVPIHGVGLQMHLALENPLDPDSVLENMTRFGKLGLEVQITEIDVQINAESAEQPLPGRLSTQAETFSEMLRALVESEAGTAFIMWGFSDKYSWLPNFMNRPEWGTIMDEQFVPKPAYNAVHEVLADFAQGKL
jgi:endo-1,4-beta-xylanase